MDIITIALGWAIGKCIADIKNDPSDIPSYVCLIISFVAVLAKFGMLKI